MTALAYRPAADQDRDFVINSWLYSYRTAHAAGLIAMGDWPAVMVPQLEKILARPGASVIVAHRPGEEDSRADIYGWIATETGHERPLVHYCYVKQPYRRLGIARGLMAASGVGDDFMYSCKTAIASKVSHRIPRARWSPLVVRFPHPDDKPLNGARSCPATSESRSP